MRHKRELMRALQGRVTRHFAQRGLPTAVRSELEQASSVHVGKRKIVSRRRQGRARDIGSLEKKKKQKIRATETRWSLAPATGADAVALTFVFSRITRVGLSTPAMTVLSGNSAGARGTSSLGCFTDGSSIGGQRRPPHNMAATTPSPKPSGNFHRSRCRVNMHNMNLFSSDVETMG